MRHIPLCLVVPLVLACGLVGPDDTTIQVQGQVTAADDGSPIVGARADVWDPCFMGPCGFHDVDTTDASGHYSLSFVLAECHPATLRLGVTHPAFVGKGGFLDGPHITCTEELQIIDVRLTRRSGTAFGPAGDGSRIRLWP